MFLIVLGHSYGNVFASPLLNILDLNKIFAYRWISIIGTATFAVDSFFFLSGFLTFYLLTTKLYPNSGKGNYI